MKMPGPVSMWFRELLCRIRGHRWASIATFQPGAARVGRFCKTCLDAEARNYRGRYPVPR